MANYVVVSSILASLLVACISSIEAWSSEGEQKLIHVGGKVLCQDCTKGWNDWVHGAKPIKGGKVSITCFDDRRRVAYYGSDETDEEGRFDLALDKRLKNGKELKAEGCLVRLISSPPDAACAIPTDFAGGKSGVKVGAPSHVYRGLVKYTVGPFYYTTPMCEDPIDAQTSKF